MGFNSGFKGLTFYDILFLTLCLRQMYNYVTLRVLVGLFVVAVTVNTSLRTVYDDLCV